MLKDPQVGRPVRCPEDRGDAAFYGQITAVFPTPCVNFQGQSYIWVEVRHPNGTKAVWPTNRLS